MQLKDFTQTDWYGLAGATPPAPGIEPKVGYGNNCQVVVDANGVNVIMYGSEEFGGQDSFYYYNCNFQMGVIIANNLAADVTADQILALGFVKV